MQRKIIVLISILLTSILYTHPSRAEFSGLEQLIGHCWQAAFPDGKRVDTHCFSEVYGGVHIKDEHVVCGPGAPYYGETWYSVDRKDSNITFRYFNSIGGYSEGVVKFDGQQIYFPEERYQQGTKEVVYKTIWTLSQDQYISEMLRKDDQHETGWLPIWVMTFGQIDLAQQKIAARNSQQQLHCHNRSTN